MKSPVATLALIIVLTPVAIWMRPSIGQPPNAGKKEDNSQLKNGQIRSERPQGQLFYKGYSIPDPNDALSVIPFAVNPSVANEIGLDDESIKVLKELLKESDGAPRGVRLSFPSGPDAPTATERDAYYARVLTERRRLVDEVLPPTKQKRLREIAYQIEVSRVGLGNALTQGKLGEDVGVYENQRTTIREKAERIELKMREQIRLVMEQAQDELLQELTPEQRATAKSCLGKPFYYRSDDYRLRDSKRFD